jgi:hypothetical protein
MASEQESFETLLEEAPSAPSPGTISVVGILSQSAEAGKFVLTLTDGRAITLETASVKGYAVLGTSVGQTIVRVDLDPAKVPVPVPWLRGWLEPQPVPWLRGWREPTPLPWVSPGAVPFALAAPQQASPAIIPKFPILDKPPILDIPKYPIHDIPKPPIADHGGPVTTPPWLDIS